MFATALETAHNQDATRLDVAEVAKAVRATIKAQVKAGKLPVDLKCAVRISRFSMGCSLYVDVTAAPFNTLNAERVAMDAAEPNTYPVHDIHSAQAKQLIADLDAIVSAYHRDNSDLMSDYHCVNFYKHVGIGSELERADRADRLAEMAAE